MEKIRILFLFLFIGLSSLTRAQKSQDGTLAKILALPNDTNKLKTYFAFADSSAFLRNHHQIFLNTSVDMFQLAEKLYAPKYELAYYFSVYHFNSRVNNEVAAFNDIKKALSLSQKLKDNEGTVHALNHVAGSYIFTLEYDKALETYNAALATAKKIKNKEVRANTTASVLTRVAKLYSEKFKDYEKALLFNEQAVWLLKPFTDNDFQIGYAYAQLGKDNYYLKHYLAAYNYCQLYLTTSTVKDGIIHSEIYNTLGKIYSQAPDSVLLKMGIEPARRYDTAINAFKKSIRLSKDDDSFLPNISRGLKDLSQLYGQNGDFKQAYYTYKNYITDRDSLENQTARKTILQMQLSNEFNKQRDSLKFKQRLTSAQLHTKQIQSYYFTGGIIALLFLSVLVFRNYKNADKEKSRSEGLLLNILPSDVAEELKEKGSANARLFKEVTVLFTDFVNFTIITQLLTPQQLVDELHTCFKAFDEIVEKYSIEKIKTIGDAYLAVSGLPNPTVKHAENAVKAAVEIAEFIKNRKEQLGDKTFDVRVGIHSGSVVAGIVGVKKFAYDVWGDTVNTAARMEQNSEPGKINVSEKTYELIKDRFNFNYRGEIEAKNKGALKMYFVETS